MHTQPVSQPPTCRATASKGTMLRSSSASQSGGANTRCQGLRSTRALLSLGCHACTHTDKWVLLVDAGVLLLVDARVMLLVDAGVMLLVDAGVMLLVDAGVMLLVDAGVMFLVDAGVMLLVDAGVRS